MTGMQAGLILAYLAGRVLGQYELFLPPDPDAPGRDAPAGRLLAVGGLLYGVTSQAGQGPGVVYSLDPASGSETVLHAFRGGGDGLREAGQPVG